MSFVAINVLTVPPEMATELEKRFGARAGQVEQSDGFESFELLRPVEGTDNYLVYTRWESQEHFQKWTESQSFSQGHAQSSARGPAATGSQLWSFEVAQDTHNPRDTRDTRDTQEL